MGKVISISVLVCLILSQGCSNDPVTRTSVADSEAYGNNQIELITKHAGIEKTWDKVISRAMASQFKIENVDSASHILSLIVSGKPKQYIDCGTKTVTTDGKISHFINTDKNYNYSAYRRNHLDTHSISNQFIGKAIIFVTGNASSSQIQVQTKLELISNQEISTTQGKPFWSSNKYKLTLTGSEKKTFDGFGTTCQSTGKFEKEVRKLL